MAGSSGDHKLSPEIKWAQRKEKIYLTIVLSDIKNEEIKTDETSLFFSGKGGSESKDYGVNLQFYKEINPSESKMHKSDRQIVFTLYKKETEQEFWPKLLKDARKPNFLKTDFERWRDEDDSDVDESKDMAFEDMMSQMGNMGTDGPPEEQDSSDSDDEELPDLE